MSRRISPWLRFPSGRLVPRDCGEILDRAWNARRELPRGRAYKEDRDARRVASGMEPTSVAFWGFSWRGPLNGSSFAQASWTLARLATKLHTGEESQCALLAAPRPSGFSRFFDRRRSSLTILVIQHQTRFIPSRPVRAVASDRDLQPRLSYLFSVWYTFYIFPYVFTPILVWFLFSFSFSFFPIIQTFSFIRSQSACEVLRIF